jgi:hypothetical protein
MGALHQGAPALAPKAGSTIRAVLDLDADTAAILLPALQTIISEQLTELGIAANR